MVPKLQLPQADTSLHLHLPLVFSHEPGLSQATGVVII